MGAHICIYIHTYGGMMYPRRGHAMLAADKRCWHAIWRMLCAVVAAVAHRAWCLSSCLLSMHHASCCWCTMQHASPEASSLCSCCCFCCTRDGRTRASGMGCPPWARFAAELAPLEGDDKWSGFFDGFDGKV